MLFLLVVTVLLQQPMTISQSTFMLSVAGTPGALIQSFAVGNNVNRAADVVLPVDGTGGDAQVFTYSAEVDFAAAAGVNYFVSVLNDTTADPDNFSQLIDADGGNAFGALNPGRDNFTPTTFATDFAVVGTTANIPEPSSLALLAIGAVGFVARRRRS